MNATQYEKMFESRINVGAAAKLQRWQKPHEQTVAWSYDMEGHARKCVERYCELANKKVEQLYRVSSLCLIFNSKHEELESVVRSLLTNCLEMLVLGMNQLT